jgi:hypothetical protein
MPNTVNQRRRTFVGEPKYDFSAASFSGAIVNIGSDLAGVTQVIYQLVPPRPVDPAELAAAYDRLAALPLSPRRG